MPPTKLYFATTDIIRDESDLQKLYLSASAQRQLKTDKIRKPEDKKLSLLAEHLLRIALKEEGITDFKIIKGEHGKPYIENESIFFNLSHSGNVCICALSDKEIGCDVERVKKANMKVAKRFFSPEEFEALENAEESEKDDLFFRIWTMKESFIKAVGTGLGMPLTSFCVDLSAYTPFISYSSDERPFQLKEYKLIDGYKISLCALNGDFAEAVEVTEI